MFCITEHLLFENGSTSGNGLKSYSLQGMLNNHYRTVDLISLHGPNPAPIRQYIYRDNAFMLLDNVYLEEHRVPQSGLDID